jgi:LysM repeat protein
LSVNMPVNPVPSCPGGTVYTIRPGDSLYSLAPRFNTTVNAILAANPGINPTSLQLGQQICIPVTPVPTTCPGGFFHTVVIGDTFYSIAKGAGIAVAALQAANPGIDPNRLQIGQQICVPATAPPSMPCPGTPYAIQSGDTFIGLARRFGYTLDALLAANPGINPQSLQVGQVICLPPSPGGGPFPCYGGSIYMVQPGDTFYGIARRFGVPLSRLIAANPDVVNPDQIQVGTPICIPR